MAMPKAPLHGALLCRTGTPALSDALSLSKGLTKGHARSGRQVGRLVYELYDLTKEEQASEVRTFVCRLKR